MVRSRSKKSKITIATVASVAVILGVAYSISESIYGDLRDQRAIIDLYPYNINGNVPDLSFYDGEDEFIILAKNSGKETSYLNVTVTAQNAQVRTDTSQFSNKASYGGYLAYELEPTLRELPFHIKPDPNVDRIILRVDWTADGSFTDRRYMFDNNVLVFDKASEPYLPNTFQYNKADSYYMN